MVSNATQQPDVAIASNFFGLNKIKNGRKHEDEENEDDQTLAPSVYR